MNIFRTAKEYIHTNSKAKKITGTILILIGLVAFFTPLTPGSWLIIIGLELLGMRILFFGSLLRRFNVASILRFFWKKVT